LKIESGKLKARVLNEGRYAELIKHFPIKFKQFGNYLMLEHVTNGKEK
jgi:hypothetical protein